MKILKCITKEELEEFISGDYNEYKSVRYYRDNFFTDVEDLTNSTYRSGILTWDGEYLNFKDVYGLAILIKKTDGYIFPGKIEDIAKYLIIEQEGE